MSERLKLFEAGVRNDGIDVRMRNFELVRDHMVYI
jgi:hypothetical protein